MKTLHVCLALTIILGAAPGYGVTLSEFEEARDLCMELLQNPSSSKEGFDLCLKAMEMAVEFQATSQAMAAGGGQTQQAMMGSGLTVGPNINISQLSGNHQEASIAVNPTNSLNLFAFSNIESQFPGLFAAVSFNGGTTWQRRTMATGSDGIPSACCDPSASWDEHGNLFVTYLSDMREAPVVVSTDGGLTFSVVGFSDQFGILADQPTVTTGANEVWLMYKEFNHPSASTPLIARGTFATGFGAVDPDWGLERVVADSEFGSWGDIAIGPNGQAGQVVMAWQDPDFGEGPASIFVSQFGFVAPPIFVTTTNVGGFDVIPPQPNRSVDAEVGLEYDRSGGPNHGRLFMVYTDETANENDDTDIFARFSDDDGVNWSEAVRVNDDTTTNSQFLPQMALDQKTGQLAVSWHDSRNDDGLGGPSDPDDELNSNAEMYASVGLITQIDTLHFLPNVKVSEGASDEDGSEPPALCPDGFPCSDLDYGDYTGLTFDDGVFYPASADNSNSTADNPDGTLSKMDVYTAQVLPEPGRLLQLGVGVVTLFGISHLRRKSV